MSTNLHHRLREATAEAHGALERDLDWRQRIVTLGGYRDLLAGLRGFHAAYEPAVGAALSDEAFFGPRRRLDHLDRDLATLGMLHDAIERLPQPTRPLLRSEAEALGVLYVLEGSTLGGTVIARAIARHHAFDESHGAAFYRGHGSATAAMWAAFLNRLDRLSGDGEASALALRSGVATFEALRGWLVNGAQCREAGRGAPPASATPSATAGRAPRPERA